MEFANQVLLTVLLGLGVVFVGLITIILLVSLLHAVMGQKTGQKEAAPAPAVPLSAPAAEIPNRQEFVAAVSAVIAEELGTDVSAIRILSVKKI